MSDILAFLGSRDVLNVLFVMALFGLGLAVLADHMQLVAKYHGAMERRVAAGYNLAMKVMVANRAGAVMYFLLIGFNIDNGLAPETIKLGFGVTMIALVPLAIYLLWRQQQQLNELASEVTSVLDTSYWPWVVVIATFITTALNLLGLTLPLLAGAIYPEWRLTLANTSFLFNTICTVINVFYIEHKFASLVDKGSLEIHGFVSGVMTARIFVFLTVGVGYLAFI